MPPLRPHSHPSSNVRYASAILPPIGHVRTGTCTNLTSHMAHTVAFKPQISPGRNRATTENGQPDCYCKARETSPNSHKQVGILILTQAHDIRILEIQLLLRAYLDARAHLIECEHSNDRLDMNGQEGYICIYSTTKSLLRRSSRSTYK